MSAICGKLTLGVGSNVLSIDTRSATTSVRKVNRTGAREARSPHFFATCRGLRDS
jgi:hypothetical protein